MTEEEELEKVVRISKLNLQAKEALKVVDDCTSRMDELMILAKKKSNEAKEYVDEVAGLEAELEGEN